MENPPGFYLAPQNENTKHCFDYPKGREPEMNFNDYVYFYSNNGRLTANVVEYDVLRKIVAKPLEEQHKMDKMMMVNEAGEIFPAHLPNIADVVGLPTVQAAIRQLENDDPAVEYEGPTPVIPKLLAYLIDPKPIIPTSGPIHSLGMSGFTNEFGHYSDDVLFLQVNCAMTGINFTVIRDQFIENEPCSRYQALNLRPEMENDKKKLALGSAIVLWNGRRITRPSFVKHFQEVVTTHNPIFIVLTEVGGTYTNCERVINKIETTMNWRLEPGKSLMGGCAIFWDPARVSADVLVTDSESLELRMIASVTAKEV